MGDPVLKILKFPVDVMIQLGAIPFCRTNLPQSIMSFDTSNPIFGTTIHPKDKSRTPGGSSGGEGALLAMKGSPLGIGKHIRICFEINHL